MKPILPDTLQLNGKVYSKQDIAGVSQASIASSSRLIREVMLFLESWFDESDMVALKTSGSTGVPKIIYAEKQKLVNSARITIEYFNLNKHDQLLLCLSPAFIAGKMMIVRAMLSGANLVTTDVEANPLALLNQPIDFAAMVPLQLAAALKESFNKFDLLKQLIIGGGSLPAEIEEEVQKISTACWHTYGMTETFSHIALRRLNGSDRNEYFSPLKGVSVSADERDCLVIVAPQLSAEPIVTNDIVQFNGGQFKVLGRYDEVIVSAGYKIHPDIVEGKLGKLISQRYFVGSARHAGAGQQVVIFVEGSLTLSELYKLWNNIENTLDSHEIPRRIIACKHFIMLQSGKIDKMNTIKACSANIG
jgi:o-succinylbenzoate---CoA ligase